MLGAASGLAWAQTAPPPGRIYAFHSTAQAGCPALDWHVVTGANGSLSGMISWDDMQHMAKATGSVSSGKVQMTATEVGGQARTAHVTGTVGSNGYFTVNISAPNVNCQGITIPFFVPTTGGNG
jgi:hypothetical protein